MTSYHAPIVPSRPICPFCQPNRNDKLKELPYFIHDLRLKVHFHSDTDFKMRHRTTELSFINEIKENPEILFVNFSEEDDKELYLRLFN